LFLFRDEIKKEEKEKEGVLEKVWGFSLTTREKVWNLVGWRERLAGQEAWSKLRWKGRRRTTLNTGCFLQWFLVFFAWFCLDFGAKKEGTKTCGFIG
jgi:hypothetical protein